jgi:hypothetical protein
MLVVLLGWVLFRASGISAALHYLLSMFGFAGNALVNDQAIFWFNENIILLALAAIFCTPVAKRFFDRISQRIPGQIVAVALILILFIFAISNMVKETYNPFIYFNF